MWIGVADVLRVGIGSVPNWVALGTLSDADVVRHATWVSVWGRWLGLLLVAVLLAYRSDAWFPGDVEYVCAPILLLLVNGLVHHRLRTRHEIGRLWLVALSLFDVALITSGVVIGDGFQSYAFLAYYPALAVFAVVFSSLRYSLAWVTVVAFIYAVTSALVGPGLDVDAGNESALVARLAVMYAIALGIGLIARFEKLRWQRAMAREQRLRQERIDLSQAIHDTTAQTAYMVNLGVQRAMELAGDADPELFEALDATLALTRSTMWEIRGPIDSGRFLEGRELGVVLSSHCATFEQIASIPARMKQSGSEPPLSWEVRAGLFSIAHNAMTNALRHARASAIEVDLCFETERTKLSVSDNGIGLPADYSERGLGVSGMHYEAESMGGHLLVDGLGATRGTTVTCIVPHVDEQRDA